MSAPSPVFLCADIGTSSLKAAYIDADGRLLAWARGVYRQLPARAADWEAALRETVASLRAQCPHVNPACIGVSGNGPTFVPVLESGAVLPPLFWNAATAKAASDVPLNSLFLPHLVAFKDASPALYDKTAAFLSCQEWLSWRLTNKKATVLPGPAFTPFYWDARQLETAGVSGSKLAPFIKLGSVFGQVSAEAAREFGLEEGAPVAACGPDFVMALLGTGTIAPGRACDRAGSSEGLNVCLAEKPGEAAIVCGLRIMPHVIEGYWNASALIEESGSIFDRFLRENHIENPDYEKIIADALASPTRPDDDSFSARAHAVLKQVAGEVKDGLASLAQAGCPASELTVSGGQAKNVRWNEYKAAVCGVTFFLPEIADGELAGDACSCAMALGEAGSWQEACGRIVRARQSIAPPSSPT
jgi:sugar (pentulose or hexulose) kinase